MLRNLSPGSTLAALRATETISNGVLQEDALTSSIADATPAEREIGIRAAFAAQKLREWKDEILRWKWPGKQEQGFGLGFIPPSNARDNGAGYRGSLPISIAEDYEARIEEIRDDLESLRIDEIKEHVLEAHQPSSGGVKSSQRLTTRASYGRLRDFTALITATVIQALPDLAKLNSLLDTWDIRLRVLKELPRFHDVLRGAQAGIEQAFRDVKDPTAIHGLTEASVDGKKLALGGQVSDMGRRIDRLLDMLEGRDDTLPQAWIDRLDKIELDYATWVVEAQHVAMRNQLSPTSTKVSEPTNGIQSLPQTTQRDDATVFAEWFGQGRTQPPVVTGAIGKEHTSGLPTANVNEVAIKSQPFLMLDPSQPKAHKREASKVSVASSMYSTFSDISNAEIVDAKSTSVLPSPKVNMADNPFRASRDELTWFGSTPEAQQQMISKPPLLQRASTASIEVFPKEKLKEVVLKRSSSWDMVSGIANSPTSTPLKALKQLTGGNSPHQGSASIGSIPPVLPPLETSPLPSPSLQVAPLRKSSLKKPQPELPRRSSKRNTLVGLSPITPTTTFDAENGMHERPRIPDTDAKQPIRKHKKSESLDEKIQDILITLPTKIVLAKDAESAKSSSSTTRSPTPTAAMTLSPAKTDSASRKGSVADPDIRLYHLTRTGQPRGAPPTKLYVRTVGDGDRVMVRVGGGWADLGEYLKEYSLHHGTRATADGRLEVASFPPNGQTANGATSQPRRKPKSPTWAQTEFESTDLVIPKARTLTQRPASPERLGSTEYVTPPPVPPIPSPYTIKSPTMRSASRHPAESVTTATVADAGTPSTPSQERYVVNSPGGITTTTVITPPPAMTTSYTPLGAAGPKMNNRRVATFGAVPSANDDWVQGMVGKARAVSSSSSPTVVQSANGTSTTVTTTTTIRSPPSTGNRRASSYFSLTPTNPPNSISSPMTISTTPSAGSITTDGQVSRQSSYGQESRKSSRMSLSDIGGIRRVFLRKKSDMSTK